MKVVFTSKIAALFLSFSLLSPCPCFSQGLTNGEIFDFKVGDEFAFRTQSIGPPFYSYSKVLSRTDFGKDSVRFGYQTTGYTLNTGTYVWEVKTFNAFFTYIDLDKPYFDLFKLQDTIAFDTMTSGHLRKKYEFKDSVYTDSCGNWNLRYIFRQAPLGETEIWEWKAAKGIGVLEYFYKRDSNVPDEFKEELLYHKNASGSCGTLKDLPSTLKNVSSNAIKIWPNPASDLLHIEAGGSYSYKITDALGREVMCAEKTEANIIYIGDLRSGIYSLLVTTNKGAFASKLVKG